MSESVLIIGASAKAERYSYKAMKTLTSHGHRPVLMHPKLKEIEGTTVYNSIPEIIDEGLLIDTITMYVRPEISKSLSSEILALAPKRVIFNPGSENPELEKTLSANGIHPEEACTLVLLQTGQY